MPVPTAPAHTVPVPSAPVPVTAVPSALPAVPDDPVAGLTVLEQIRGIAYAAGRPQLLAHVYPGDSPLLTEDRAALAGLVNSGNRVQRLGFTFTGPKILTRTAVRAELTVSIRQQPAVLVRRDGTSSALSARDLGRVAIVLTRASPRGVWRIAGSRPAAAAPT